MYLSCYFVQCENINMFIAKQSSSIAHVIKLKLLVIAVTL